MNQVGRFALRVPVLGWLLHDAINGLPDAKYYFAVNCAAVLVAAIYFLGYPFVVMLALMMTAMALALLIFMTAQDSFSKGNREDLANAKRKPRRAI